MSDHGMHMNGPYNKMQQVKEVFLPTFFIGAPKKEL